MLIHIFTAATQLIAINWKSLTVPSVEEGLVRVRSVCLSVCLSKLSAIYRYRAGDMSKLRKYREQWMPLVLYLGARYRKSDFEEPVFGFL